MVYVGNLPTRCTGRQVLCHFNRHLSCTPCIRQKAKIFETQNSVTYSLLYFDSNRKAWEAIRTMNGSLFLGKKLVVQPYVRPRSVREPYVWADNEQELMSKSSMKVSDE